MNTHNPIEDHKKHKEGKPNKNVGTNKENTVGKDGQIGIHLIFGLRKLYPGDERPQ